MAIFNASGASIALDFRNWLLLTGLSQSVDATGTPVNTGSQFSETYPGGYRIDYFGIFSNYETDNEAGLQAPLSARVTGIRTSLNGSTVGEFSGMSFDARSVFQLDDLEQNAAIFSGNDQITGGQASDFLLGFAGNDQISGGPGNDSIDGGDGQDLAGFGYYLARYTLNQTGSTYGIDGAEGTDLLNSIERLSFGDACVALDIDGNAGKVYRLYKSAFARSPDLGGLGNWIAGMDAGQSLEQVAGAFVASEEFQSLYGANPSAGDFVELLYLNVMGRAPDAGGLGHWTYQIESGTLSRAQVLAQFSESEENRTAVHDRIKDGIIYTTAAQSQSIGQGLTVNGSSGADELFGSVGKDIFNGQTGDDLIDGGAGIDIAVYSGASAIHVIAPIEYVASGKPGFTVTGSADGVDTVFDIERFQFTDKMLAFDITGNAGQVYRLYQAAFDRTPDTAGLSDWIRGMDQGMTLRKVATGFIGSGEFIGKYGENTTDNAFIDLLYQNVLNRSPDEAGRTYWMSELERGMTREMALIGFSESAENQAAVIGAIQNGIEMTLG